MKPSPGSAGARQAEVPRPRRERWGADTQHALGVMDLTLILLFLLISLACWRLQSPIGPADLSSDQANIASFAAARNHPAAFERDTLLSDPDNYAWYTPLQVQLVGALEETAGGFPQGYALLVAPVLTLWLAGSYLLFRELSGSRILAAGLALFAGFLRLDMPTGELWDLISVDAMFPRTVFTAVLPWVLLLAWRLRARPRLWIAVGVACGALWLVHPGSSPAWTAALVTAYALSAPRGERPTAKTPLWVGTFLLGAALLAAPFAIRYWSSRARSASGRVDYGTLYRMAVDRLPPGYFDIPGTVIEHMVALANWRVVIGALALVAYIAAAAWAARGEARPGGAIRFWGAGLLGFGLVTLAVPWAEQTLSRLASQMPFTFNLVRGLRFWPMWCAILVSAGTPALLNAAREAQGDARDSSALVRALNWRHGGAVLPTLFCGLLGLGWWTLLWRPPAFLNMRAAGLGGPRAAATLLAALADPEILAPYRSPAKVDLDNALEAAAALTPPTALFVGPIQLRFSGPRPLAFAYKDGGTFLYVNAPAALAWKRAADLKESVKDGTPDQQREVLRKIGGEYAFIGRKSWGASQPVEPWVLYANARWVVVDLRPQ